jgi:hypothetical protein
MTFKSHSRIWVLGMELVSSGPTGVHPTDFKKSVELPREGIKLHQKSRVVWDVTLCRWRWRHYNSSNGRLTPYQSTSIQQHLCSHIPRQNYVSVVAFNNKVSEKGLALQWQFILPFGTHWIRTSTYLSDFLSFPQSLEANSETVHSSGLVISFQNNFQYPWTVLLSGTIHVQWLSVSYNTNL